MLDNLPRLLTAIMTTEPDAPWCLDLFCGAGGAGMGYKLAGFNVLGVDIAPQPRYPGWFVQADALEFAREYGHLFGMIHASAMCQGYSNAVSSCDSPWVQGRGKNTPRLIAPVSQLLQQLGKPYVIENVNGSQDELAASLMLCGSMFGLFPARHRFFEVSHFIPQPPHIGCRGQNQRVAQSLGVDPRDVVVAGKSRKAGSIDTWRAVMLTPWMDTAHEIKESIPPFMTHYIGQQMMRAIQHMNDNRAAEGGD